MSTSARPRRRYRHPDVAADIRNDDSNLRRVHRHPIPVIPLARSDHRAGESVPEVLPSETPRKHSLIHGT